MPVFQKEAEWDTEASSMQCFRKGGLQSFTRGFPGGSSGDRLRLPESSVDKESACNEETPVRFLDQEDPREKG